MNRVPLSWVFSVFKTRDRTVMITLYKSLVRSLLEYCCPLWDPTKFTEIQMLEGVQRTFTSRRGGLNDMNYWKRLGWPISSQSDVLTAKEGKVYHFYDVKNPSLSCS